MGEIYFFPHKKGKKGRHDQMDFEKMSAGAPGRRDTSPGAHACAATHRIVGGGVLLKPDGGVLDFTVSAGVVTVTVCPAVEGTPG